MAGNDVSFDQIRDAPEYDLMHIYNDTNDTDSVEQSVLMGECSYYDPQHFSRQMSSRPRSSYFHLNCRGLSKNWDHSDDFMFDCIGISEAFQCEGDNRLKLSGYHAPIFKCRNNGNRGGVGLYVKEDRSFTVREDLSIFIPNVFESVFVDVVQENHKHITIGVIYRPNSYPLADIDIFSLNLFNIMDSINKENKHSIIMGDMNIDLLKYRIHNKTNDYLDAIFSNGFVPLYPRHTGLASIRRPRTR